ncbi:MAG: spermidine synthase, partial [Clostridiales bacterium]|nr:spermidine synthase [Clostridiales bacterium]
IDSTLIDVCKEYLPTTAVGYLDLRVTVHIQDGLKFIRKLKDVYDLIIVDSTDPFGPGEVLFTKEFYGNCYKALREYGIMINQHESAFYSYEATAMKRAHKRIKESFPIHEVYQAHIPSYPSGHWLFGFASINYKPLADLDADRWNSLGIATRYYNTDLHKGAFYLPNYVKDMLDSK